MSIFSDAKENYEQRKKIADYNYRAREYISDGQRIYQEAYNKLCDAFWKVEDKIHEHQRYKEKIAAEINSSLREIDASHKEYKISVKTEYLSLGSSSITQEEKLDFVDKALATWVTPSVSDLFNDNTMEYYEAKNNLSRAKWFKEDMRRKRDEMSVVRTAIQKIPEFMYEERKQIDELMQKFRKTNALIKNGGSNTKEQVDALCQIAEIIAGSLTTQFLDNNYEITESYHTVHNKIVDLNSSMSNLLWLR